QLLDDGIAWRRAPANAGAHAQARAREQFLLGLLRRSVGSEIPWHDRRVRLAANYAIDRQAINQAETLGFSRMTYSMIPSHFEFFWQPPPIPFDRARARQLLAEAGYPNGFDAGDFTCDAVHAGIAEPVANDLQAAGIRVKLRP